MGVMACSRAGCENIMCGRYSKLHGDICEDCFKELCEGYEVRFRSIDHFMNTIKGIEAPRTDYRKLLEDIFKLRQ